MFFLQIRAQGLATSPNPVFSKLITSLLGHRLLHCNCLRLGLTGANLLHLFWKWRQDLAYVLYSSGKSKQMKCPRSGVTLLLPRISSPKSKVAVAAWRSSHKGDLETKPSHSSSDELIQLERQNKTKYACIPVWIWDHKAARDWDTMQMEIIKYWNRMAETSLGTIKGNFWGKMNDSPMPWDLLF